LYVTFRYWNSIHRHRCLNSCLEVKVRFVWIPNSTKELAIARCHWYPEVTRVTTSSSEVGDTNLQVFHNDASGTATKIDLGVNFPANRTAGAISTTVYSIELYNEPMSTDVKYKVTNKETGAIANGTISANLPLSSQGLNFFASRCMSTTSVTSTGQFDLMKLGVYSQL